MVYPSGVVGLCWAYAEKLPINCLAERFRNGRP